MQRRTFTRTLATLAVAALVATPAVAQWKPSKPINLIVPWAAGGSTDVGIASTVFAARDLDLGIVVARDCCYSARGNNNQFFMERVFPRMGRVMDTDDIVKLMLAGAKNAKKR